MFLLRDLASGGAERVSLDLAIEFKRLGHKVEFVLMKTRGELLKEARELFNRRPRYRQRAESIYTRETTMRQRQPC